MTLETTQNARRWSGWLQEVGVSDPYYRADYGRMWEADEKGEWVGLHYDAGRAGRVIYSVIRDPLDYVDGAAGYCDIRTAYDFGGPVARGEAPRQAMRQFRDAVGDLADKWGVVTEFARLHPYRVNPLPEGAHFHAENLHVDLSVGLDAVRSAYDGPHAERIDEAKQSGVTIEVWEDEAPEGRGRAFLELYYRTMLRVGAGPHYFFLPETLQALVAYDQMVLATARLEEESKTIGAGLFFRAADTLFYFLSGSHPQYLSCRPNNLMLDRMVEYGVKRGFERLHLGGGSDSLRRFKGQVANGSTDYYVLTQVHDAEAYEQLARSVGAEPEEDGAFPVYWPEKYAERQRPPLF